MEIIKEGDLYRLEFRYNPLIIAKIKEIPGRRYDYLSKSWTVPEKNLAALERFAKRYNFVFADRDRAPEVIPTVPDMPELVSELNLKMELFPYQKNGVQYCINQQRVIIGDQPGLGKTAQAIATIAHAQAFPCLVVCPSSLKINWQREWEKWTGYKAMILNDQVKNNFHLYWQSGLIQVFIVNYESLKKYFVEKIDTVINPETKKKMPLRLNHVHFKKHINLFKSVVIDESHRVKSTATQQTKFTKGIATGKDWILALTGTPVINKPKDLISQLGIINKLNEFGGYKNFVSRYCAGPREASNLKELNALLRTHCFYRREKAEVLKDLPPKIRQVVICEIDARHRKEYNDAEADLVRYLKEYKEATDAQVRKSMRGEVMVRIGVLKNISARGKLNDVFEFISDTLETGEKLIVFAHLKEVIHKIREQFPESLAITGDTKIPDRQVYVDQFQMQEKTKLMVCSTKAAGVGLTLTAASMVSFVELPWTYADCEQAEDRAHRIGQKDSVTAYYFLGRDTIDEKIYKIIQEKKDIVKTVTGSDEEIPEDVISAIADLFNQESN